MKKDKLSLPCTDGNYIISFNDIIYVEADSNYCFVHTKTQNTPLYVTKPLKKFDLILKKSHFLRTHNSFILNINEIEKFVNKDGGYICMKNIEQTIPISQRRRVEIYNFFNDFSL